MIKNYLTIALRNFLKQKGFAFINILGLAIGLASSLLIFLYINDELSYDTIHPHYENTYRLGYTGVRQDGTEFQASGVPGAWAAQLKEQLPDVKEALRYFWAGYPASVNDKDNDKILLTETLFWVEPTYPEVLNFKVLKGDRRSFSETRNSLAISRNIAKQFFGDADPIGKTLVYKHPWMTGNEEIQVVVTTVFEDYPSNSHIKPNYLVNYHTLNGLFDNGIEDFLNNWERGWLNSYIVTTPNADSDQLLKQLNQMLQTNLGENAINYKPILRKVSDIHFDNVTPWTTDGPGDLSYIYIFGSIALLIILVASINYMNLATARSAKRSKEVGMRKSFGSSRKQLMFQFFSESFITTLAALLLAVILVIVALPLFNDLAHKSFTINAIFSSDALIILLVTMLVVSLMAGSYPAVYLSGFRPIEVLKTKFVSGKNTEFFRRMLVVVQFSISIILIISTIIVVMQMSYIRSSKLSEQGDQILSIRYGGTAPSDRYQTFKNLVLQDSDIDRVTMANHLPRQSFFGGINETFTFPDVSSEPYVWSQLNVDFDFPKTYDLEFVAGRDFSAQNLADSNAFILNETALQHLNIGFDQALGMAASVEVNDNESVDGKVIGVVKDFPYRSMHETIGPLVISARPHPIDKIVYVQLSSEGINEKIASLHEKWKEIFPGIGFDYWFVSEEFGRMYQAEERMAGLIKNFSVLAIFIACMGLFGLASYMAERRTKEIGIRKVMGASSGQMVTLLFSTFAKLLAFSAVVALPLSYFLMNSWLQNFVYHVGLSWWVFVISILLVTLLTVITVGYESLKASMANPVDSIRYE
ncbi:ABC transporter permease [Fulvivirgaceae bacterium BMA12]|uniref:ABC transporter permease n=1 Tax=Agaribacillus aureus TaxID=3051825 RepID=A0ABT8L3K4_9BACT|nr:ABC transporter permease [Fulvivirgaceae bacterium BMA12]